MFKKSQNLFKGDEKHGTAVSSRASSADRSAEKRTISMTFPYTPLRSVSPSPHISTWYPHMSSLITNHNLVDDIAVRLRASSP